MDKDNKSCIKCCHYSDKNKDCHYNPPIGYMYQAGVVKYFPLVTKDDWCREFKQRLDGMKEK